MRTLTSVAILMAVALNLSATDLPKGSDVADGSLWPKAVQGTYHKDLAYLKGKAGVSTPEEQPSKTIIVDGIERHPRATRPLTNQD